MELKEDVTWAASTRVAWGKTRPDDGAWLPLTAHLEDTAAVAERLWDGWLAPITRSRIAAALGGDMAAARALFIWLAGVHDVAKLAPAFAGKARDVGMPGLVDAMERAGLRCPTVARDDYAHHGVMGHVTVRDWLMRTRSLNRNAAESLAVVIGGHHGVPATDEALRRLEIKGDTRRGPGGWGDQAWSAARDNVLEVMAARTGVAKALALLPEKGLPLPVQVDLSAAVTVADWLASDTDRFPYDGLEAPDQRRAEGIASITLPPPWTPPLAPADQTPEALLIARFPHLEGVQIHPFQEAMIRAALDATEPQIIVGEAPTGGGKTEGALLAAEILASQFGCGGTMVALPTMATSDAMFTRVNHWLETLPADDKVSVYLAHSKAALNEDFSALTSRSRNSFDEVYDDDESSRAKGGPVVDSWLRGRKRGLLADHVIGTIDQVLMGALQSKHLSLRHLALSSKVVIVDEVHAADDYMRSYLCRALDWLGAYGTPVVLLSATLPSAQRRELVEAYTRGRLGRAGKRTPIEVPDAPSYPCLTIGGSQVSSVAVAAPQKNVNVAIDTLPDEHVVDTVVDATRNGGCVAVIRNTVGRAQDTFRELQRHLGDEVVLLHSRFIGPDRASLERDVRQRLGSPRSGAVRPHRLVVVGTQVLEQSLDVDFDLMVSDIAPIDLLLQRLGRVHRHDRPHARPAGMQTPKLLITGLSFDGEDGSAPQFDRGCIAVYGDYRLLRATAVLLPHFAGLAISSPADVPRLVEQAYADDAPAPPGWEARWDMARTAHELKVADAKSKASTFQIEDPRRRLSLVNWLPTPVQAESDELERQGKAQVRDSEDSLEVVLVCLCDDGLTRVMPGAHELSDAVLPSQLGWGEAAVAKAAATCTVRLPRALTHPGVIDDVIDEIEGTRGFEGWRDDPWLGGQLILPLDESLTTHVAGHLVTYDRQLGLLVEAGGSTKEDM